MRRNRGSDQIGMGGSDASEYIVEQAIDIELIGKDLGARLGLSWARVRPKLGPSWDQVGTKSAPSWRQVENLLAFAEMARSITAIMELLEWKNRTKFRAKYITPVVGIGTFANDH